jgi:hypothetical protein
MVKNVHFDIDTSERKRTNIDQSRITEDKDMHFDKNFKNMCIQMGNKRCFKVEFNNVT